MTTAIGPDNLAAYGALRDGFIERVTRVLEADRRVAAAWLAGSIGRGEADEWSDLDLCIAVHDSSVTEFWEDRRRLYDRIGRQVLIQPEMPANAGMAGGTFQLVIFDGPVEIDFCVGSVGSAERFIATRLLFDRVGIPIAIEASLAPEERRGHAEWWLTFFWAMAPIAVKYAGRGETRSAASQIDLLTQSLIALWRLIEQPDGPSPWNPTTNRPIEDELDVWLPKLGRTIDPASALTTIAALAAEVERRHPALAALDVAIPVDMPGQVARMVEIAAEALTFESSRPARKYR